MGNKTKIFIFGKTGRMGQEINLILQGHPKADYCGGRSSGHDEGNVDDADVFIDFSNPLAIPSVLELAVSHGKPLVIGTTGLTHDDLDAIQHASVRIPIIQASNTSLGIAVLSKISQQVAQILDEAFDIEISESHHRHKLDAPSGTALSLGEVVARGRHIDFNPSMVDLNRQGERDRRIGFSVRRGGGIIGDHTVAFIGQDEMIELSHRGLSRRLFAQGAIKAALWLKDRPAGLYSMADVLF
ncbi:MAG: 4-hydroxy-tetrahydrodipicolinate reductase [Candidatus Paracaedibacteraceae bacterium]|nr:4-hydroxy-tetrahydrodipicolinate reductase [Candidatus Paracaedibacteraceae bacterium]